MMWFIEVHSQLEVVLQCLEISCDTSQCRAPLNSLTIVHVVPQNY